MSTKTGIGSRLVAIAFLLGMAALSANAAEITALTGFTPDLAAMAAVGALGMTTFTEGRHAGEYLISEASGTRSRDVVTLATGNDLEAGTVLGRIRGAATSAAVGTNTGNGAMGTVTLGAGAMEGDYKVIIVEPASDAGAFVVENPLGAVIGHGTVGVAFTGGGLSFTLADGATNFVAGDTFKITVAAGTTYGQFDQDGTDGTEVAVAVLFDAVDATSADKPAVVHSRDCEVAASKLTWPSDIEAGEKTTALAQLAAAGIIAR